MSRPPVRRADKVMLQAEIDDLLSTGYCGHLATVGPDGSPYVCPLLYVRLGDQIWLHNTSAHGHLQTNVRHSPRVASKSPTKYHPSDATRPKGFYPRLDETTVYALTVERITGKMQRLPPAEQQWPARDHTRSPEASPPSPPFHE